VSKLCSVHHFSWHVDYCFALLYKLHNDYKSSLTVPLYYTMFEPGLSLSRENGKDFDFVWRRQELLALVVYWKTISTAGLLRPTECLLGLAVLDVEPHCRFVVGMGMGRRHQRDQSSTRYIGGHRVYLPI